MSSGEIRSHIWSGKNFQVAISFTRAGVAQHILIKHNDTLLLVDAGDGVLRDMLDKGLEPPLVDAIFITHGHYDHMGGLHSFLGYLRMIGRSRVLEVYLPQGCTEALLAIDGFRKCYPDSTPFEIRVVQLQPGESASVSEVTVEAFGVVHCGSIAGGEVLDRIPALGYRFMAGSEVVAVSGDTGQCPSLTELVKDADLAIIEATYESSVGRSRDVLRKVHLSEDIAHEIGKSAKNYILVHKGRRS